MSLSNYICPGDGHVWVYPGHPVDGNEYIGNSSEVLKLPAIITWELTNETEEATSIRTSDTNGLKVKPCGDTLEWKAVFTCALDPQDWSYCYLLEDKGAGQALMPGDTKSYWVFVTWDSTYRTLAPHDYHGWSSAATAGNGINPKTGGTPSQPSGNHTGDNTGIWFFGEFNPPSISVDNDASDASTSDFSCSIAHGPYFPACGTLSPYQEEAGPDVGDNVVNSYPVIVGAQES